jgi:hypothetical protein
VGVSRGALKVKGKGKVVPVLLTKHHAMKACWGSGCILILYNNISRLIPFLKFIYVSVQICNIFVFIISFKLINFVFQISLFFFPNILLVSRLKILLIISIDLAWVLQPL